MMPRFRQESLDPAKTTGLILCGMGGPATGDDVQPFLKNLFSDPLIIPLPRLISPLVARFIAHRRAPKVKERYAVIGAGGGSPQLDWTRRQGERLVALAAEASGVWKSAPAMSYWHPFPEEAIDGLLKMGAEQFLALPMYPQYSDVTSGGILNEVERHLKRLAPGKPVHTLTDWHLLDGYIGALSESVTPTLTRWAEAGHDPASCALLFVAHSLPESFIARGDPYVSQTRASVAAVHAHLNRSLLGYEDWLSAMPGGGTSLLAFQSRVGPVKWVGPDVPDEAVRLAVSGCRRIHIQPVSFTCEHIETLHELDIELKETVTKAGITEFSRGPALNLSETWLESLSAHLMQSVFAPREDAHVRT